MGDGQPVLGCLRSSTPSGIQADMAWSNSNSDWLRSAHSGIGSDNLLLRFSAPSEDEVRRFISKHRTLGFWYPDVGASATAIPTGYNVIDQDLFYGFADSLCLCVSVVK